uniref:Uncharacterized protein n=1 Tax=Drosophila melanogaster TaxID=7227 RepID=A0A1W5PW65_DROME|nr:uncharacterized protein Dmel_CG46308 [Drosophila melanogaster]API64986.1 uncharacterized protein Dmel_CG46308 [Drosophila melanogaster]|eukprot:NP_001334736.1 uncharacterized protein Dmel_CG46308 [Drosophila melanogaster]
MFIAFNAKIQTKMKSPTNTKPRDVNAT